MTTPRPLTDPETRIELRDAATCAWHECSEDDPVRVRASHVAQYIRSCGYLATVCLRPTASSPVTVNAISPTGRGDVLSLDWEPHIDGFDYEESGDDADAVYGPPPDSLLSPDPAEPEPEAAVTRYRVSFEDTIEAATEEEAYDLLLSYLSEVVRHRDLTPFGIEPEPEPVIDAAKRALDILP